MENGLVKAKQDIDLNDLFQVKASMGSVIIVNRLLPHTTGPNHSNNTRFVVWFRISTKRQASICLTIFYCKYNCTICTNIDFTILPKNQILCEDRKISQSSEWLEGNAYC